MTEINTLVGCKKILSDVLFYLLKNNPKSTFKSKQISAIGLRQIGSFWRSIKIKNNIRDIFQKLPIVFSEILIDFSKKTPEQLTAVFLKLSFCFPWEFWKAESSRKKPFGSFLFATKET